MPDIKTNFIIPPLNHFKGAYHATHNLFAPVSINGFTQLKARMETTKAKKETKKASMEKIIKQKRAI
jgi:hypothetical protein